MSGAEVDTMAKLYAERLMRGDNVTEAEMHVIMAGLMLSVDRLAHAVDGFRDLLWSEEKLRLLIRSEVKCHCSERCGQWPVVGWLCRLIKTVFAK